FHHRRLLILVLMIVPPSLLFFFFFYCSRHHPDLHSFPTRRSSDLPSTASPLGGTKRTSGSSSVPALTSTPARMARASRAVWPARSEEHTSELQSRFDLVCRLLLEKKKYTIMTYAYNRTVTPPIDMI